MPFCRGHARRGDDHGRVAQAQLLPQGFARGTAGAGALEAFDIDAGARNNHRLGVAEQAMFGKEGVIAVMLEHGRGGRARRLPLQGGDKDNAVPSRRGNATNKSSRAH